MRRFSGRGGGCFVKLVVCLPSEPIGGFSCFEGGSLNLGAFLILVRRFEIRMSGADPGVRRPLLAAQVYTVVVPPLYRRPRNGSAAV